MNDEHDKEAETPKFGHPSSGVKAWPVGGHGARSRACVGLEA